MLRRLSLATAFLLCDGGRLLWVKLGLLYIYTDDGSLVSAGAKLYSTRPCRSMQEQPPLCMLCMGPGDSCDVVGISGSLARSVVLRPTMPLV